MTELLSLLIKSLLAKPSCVAWPLCLLSKEAFFHPTPIMSIWVFCSIEHHSANSTSAAVSPLVFVTDDIVQPSYWHWHLSCLRAITSVLHERFFGGGVSFLLRVCVCVGVSGAVLGAGIVIGTQNRDCEDLQCGENTFSSVRQVFSVICVKCSLQHYISTLHFPNSVTCQTCQNVTWLSQLLSHFHFLLFIDHPLYIFFYVWNAALSYSKLPFLKANISSSCQSSWAP